MSFILFMFVLYSFFFNFQGINGCCFPLLYDDTELFFWEMRYRGNIVLW